MIDAQHPNRWFGSNPQAISSQGRKLTAFDREVPKDWRSALGLDEPGSADAPAGEATAR